MATSYIGRSDLPIGLRNNNPGNIRPGDAWQGMTGENGGFIVFQDVTWGIRALATDITNKIQQGYNTIGKIGSVKDCSIDKVGSIISRYAPPSENNTASYISAVSADTGIPANQVIDLDAETLHDLIRAIMNHENGDQYSALISDQDIDTGISMMSNSLLQLVDAAGIAIQHPTTPGGLYVLGGIALLLWLGRTR